LHFFANPNRVSKIHSARGAHAGRGRAARRAQEIINDAPNAHDGTDYENYCRFVEIHESEKIVLDHIETMHRFQLTMTLTRVAEGTHIEWRQVFESTEECERIRPFVTEANEQNLDRLAKLVEDTTAREMGRSSTSRALTGTAANKKSTIPSPIRTLR